MSSSDHILPYFYMAIFNRIILDKDEKDGVFGVACKKLSK